MTVSLSSLVPGFYFIKRRFNIFVTIVIVITFFHYFYDFIVCVFVLYYPIPLVWNKRILKSLSSNHFSKKFSTPSHFTPSMIKRVIVPYQNVLHVNMDIEKQKCNRPRSTFLMINTYYRYVDLWVTMTKQVFLFILSNLLTSSKDVIKKDVLYRSSARTFPSQWDGESSLHRGWVLL